jgi:predicted glycosyltransferase
MRLLFNCGHPADVHFFKNVIWNLQSHGHEVAIASREKDVTTSLLDCYGFKHEVHTKATKGRIRILGAMLRKDYKLYMLARRFKPDILVGGMGSVCVPTVARMIRKPSIIFDDTEHSRYEHLIMDRLATAICTPTCYQKDLGRKHVRVDGYKELAYLHPNYFKPDHSVLAELGLTEGQRFAVVRFVSWGASHDIGQSGFSKSKDVVRSLEPYVRVLITSEGGLDADLEKYRITVPPQKLHDLLYFATLYVGEGATIASE